MALSSKGITALAAACGIPLVGFTDPSPLTPCLPHLEKRLREGGTPFVNRSPQVRIDYAKAFPAVKGVMVIGLPYSLLLEEPVDMAGRGRISAFCQGTDYHLLVKKAMADLMGVLTEEMGEVNWRGFVDDARLVDRGSAWRAGLGFFGKNNTLINPKYGSGFFIGQILVDQPIDYMPATPLKSQCGNCTRCLEACPTHALKSGFSLDGSLCLSHLTQKKSLKSAEASVIRRVLYGCDLCQLACPFNSKQPVLKLEDSQREKLFPRLGDILSMDEAAFLKIYGESALNWRGLDTLKRNAQILNFNKKNEPGPNK